CDFSFCFQAEDGILAFHVTGVQTCALPICDVPAKGGWSIFVTTWHMSEILDPLRNCGVSANGEKAWFGWADVPEVEALRGKFLRSEERRVGIESSCRWWVGGQERYV